LRAQEAKYKESLGHDWLAYQQGGYLDNQWDFWCFLAVREPKKVRGKAKKSGKPISPGSTSKETPQSKE
jgi:hypothetical protein